QVPSISTQHQHLGSAVGAEANPPTKSFFTLLA
ncbi:Unannotated, partial [Lentimonas sp. CC4]